VRQTGQGRNTAHPAPNVFSAFQKHYLVTRRTLQFLKAIQLLTKENSNDINRSNFIAADNEILLPTKYMFLEQV
jgi:hypothetical protein